MVQWATRCVGQNGVAGLNPNMCKWVLKVLCDVIYGIYHGIYQDGISQFYMVYHTSIWPGIYHGRSHLTVYHTCDITVLSHIRYITWYIPLWYIGLVYHMVCMIMMIYIMVYNMSYTIHGMVYTVSIYHGISHIRYITRVISHMRYITWYIPWYIGMIYSIVYIIPILHAIYHTWYGI